MKIDTRVCEPGVSPPMQFEWPRRDMADDPLAQQEKPLSVALASPGRQPWRRPPLRLQRLLLFAWMLFSDALAIGAAFRVAYWLRFEKQLTLAPEVTPSIELYGSLAMALLALWLATFSLFGLYDAHRRAGGTVESARVLRACTMAAMLVIVTTFLFPTFIISRMWLVASWALSFLFVAANRFGLRRMVRVMRGRGLFLAPAVIVGTNEEAGSLAAFLGDWRASGVWTVGFVSTQSFETAVATGKPVLGSAADIADVVRQHGIEDVIVAITSIHREELLRLCEDVDSLPVTLRLSSGLYEMLTTRVQVQTLDMVPLLSLQKNRLTRREAVAKALVDQSLSWLGLALLWPLMLLVAVAVKLDSEGPVLYRRRVLGACGREFDAFKFRTMFVNGSEILAQRPDACQELSTNHKLKNDPRVTRVGHWLRRFSLDELPQLFNVIAGQMSLVGPRMISPGEARMYGRHRMNLLTVKPGITGLWQVSGRSDVSYEERVRLDMYYVRNYDLWLDFQILFIRTLPVVLKGRGAY